MIIEAGYELQLLVQPILLANESSRKSLWLLAMDKDLRFLYPRKVLDTMGTTIEPHIDEIIGALGDDCFQTHYFAVAHMVPHVSFSIYEELSHLHEKLQQAASPRGFELIGHLVFDEECWYSSGPMHSFRDYPGNDYPRAAMIPGPHEWGCSCPACAQREEYIADLRATAAAARGTDADAAGLGAEGRLD